MLLPVRKPRWSAFTASPIVMDDRAVIAVVAATGAEIAADADGADVAVAAVAVAVVVAQAESRTPSTSRRAPKDTRHQWKRQHPQRKLKSRPQPKFASVPQPTIGQWHTSAWCFRANRWRSIPNRLKSLPFPWNTRWKG